MREFQMSKHYAVSTQFGLMDVWLNRGTHIAVKTKASDSPEGVVETITVNRVAHTLSAHMHIVDGQVDATQDRKLGMYSMHRADSDMYVESSRAAIGKAFSILTADLQEFIESDEGQAAVLDAKRMDANNQLYQLERDEFRLRAELDEVLEKKEAAEKMERELS